MFIWAANFRGLTAAFASPSDTFANFHRRESSLTVNKIWVFHPGGGGICPFLFHPNTRDLLLLLFYPTVSLNFGRCPISLLTTHSPRMMNNSTMHTHPTQRDVTVHMKCMMLMHSLSCYIYIYTAPALPIGRVGCCLGPHFIVGSFLK